MKTLSHTRESDEVQFSHFRKNDKNYKNIRTDCEIQVKFKRSKKDRKS